MYHFIGIKGTGMSALAIILKQLGNDVDGSDIDKHFFTEVGLIENNIKFFVYDENNIRDNMIIIKGGSIKDDNVELKKAKELGLKIYEYPENIADVDYSVSSWFEGYNEKYFHDKGALYYCISNKYSKLLCLQFLLRKRKKVCENIDIIRAYKLMVSGIKDFK